MYVFFDLISSLLALSLQEFQLRDAAGAIELGWFNSASRLKENEKNQ